MKQIIRLGVEMRSSESQSSSTDCLPAAESSCSIDKRNKRILESFCKIRSGFCQFHVAEGIRDCLYGVSALGVSSRSSEVHRCRAQLPPLFTGSNGDPFESPSRLGPAGWRGGEFVCIPANACGCEDSEAGLSKTGISFSSLQRERVRTAAEELRPLIGVCARSSPYARARWHI